MKILLTGAAGFIGFHATRLFLDAGADVVGVDNLTDYYDVGLKLERLQKLVHPRFTFIEADVAERGALKQAAGEDVEAILHLAAQAGVRYSLENPFSYERSNLAGHLSVLEYARGLKRLSHMVYASSSSVYGNRQDAPFLESDRCDAPASLYAATKRSCELMSEAYAGLFDIPQTGLRFFTVYGPWGRPDMAYWSFTRDILAGRPITLFNHGELERDFTFVDDVVSVFPKIIETIPTNSPRHRIYNLGNNQPVKLARFVQAIETALGRPAKVEFADMQPGDVYRTCADIEEARKSFQFAPSTSIEVGIRAFVDWYTLKKRD